MAHRKYSGEQYEGLSSFAPAKTRRAMRKAGDKHRQELLRKQALWKKPDAWRCGFGRGHEKQEAFFKACFDGVHDEVGFGGAVGVGKSYALAFAMIHHCLAYPGYRWMYGRVTLTNLKDTAWPILRICAKHLERKCGLQFRERHSKDDLGLTFITDPGDDRYHSTITASPLADPSKIQGASYDGIAVDEAPLCSAEVFEELAQRRRGSEMNIIVDPKTRKLKWPLLFCWSGNPAPGYIHENFVIPYQNGELGKGEHKYKWFIQCDIHDNPYKDTKRYSEQILAASNSQNARNRVYGTWDFSESAVYQVPETTFERFDPYEITQHPLDEIQWLAGYDYGSNHPSVFVRGFIHNKTLYIYEEYRKRKAALEDQAHWVRNRPRTMVYADKTIKQQTKAGHKRFISEDFQELGVLMIPANEGNLNDVQTGVVKVQRALDAHAIKIHPDNCPHLTRALKNWSYVPLGNGQYDDKKLMEQHKDENDALRYLIINIVHELKTPRYDIGYRPEDHQQTSSQTHEKKRLASLREKQKEVDRLAKRPRRVYTSNPEALKALRNARLPLANDRGTPRRRLSTRR